MLAAVFLAMAAIAPSSDSEADLLPGSKGAATSPSLQQGVDLMVGRSQHFTTPWPVAGASLTDPLVANVDVVRPDLILVSGTGEGTTDLILWSEDGLTEVMKITVRVDLDQVREVLGATFQGLSLDVQQSGGVTLIRGTLSNAEQALELRAIMDKLGKDYIDLTRLPGVQQVQVKVRVAEVSRTKIRSLGINGLRTGDDFFIGSTIGPSNGGPINPINIGNPQGSSAAGNAPFLFNSDVNVGSSVTMFGGVPSADLQVFIEALAENQYLRILAEPNLVALSGEEASFLAGGEFPIPVVQGGGAAAGPSITIVYKEFGVGLRFRPVVLGEGAIRLEIASEVSELTDIGAVELQGFQVPAVVTRRTETAVELKSGQTLAMSGLIDETTNAQVSKVPGLGSLPILGSLFRSVRYKSGETELLVLVTASLVEPLSRTSFPPLPGTEHVEPSDWELYVAGSIEGMAPAKLSYSAATRMEDLGLSRLRGPGTWASHGEGVPRSRAEPGATPPEKTPAEGEDVGDQ